MTTTIDCNKISLEKLVDIWPPEKVQQLLNSFKCRDPDVERFLKEDAISYHNNHRSRSYLFLSEDLTKVLAYVTLGINCFKIPKENNLFNKVKKDMSVNKDISQSFLIGQLGKADGVEKGIGKELIDFSVGVFKVSFRTLGCRTIRVDCKKELIKYYDKNGFRLVSQKEGGGDLYHMVLLF